MKHYLLPLTIALSAAGVGTIWRQSNPDRPSAPAIKVQQTQLIVANTVAKPMPSPLLAPARRLEVARSIRADLFSPPEPPAPARIKTPPAKPPVEPPVEKPAPPDPLFDYVYTGTVTVDGETQALLENAKTKVGTYLKVGDSFQGSQVMQITDQEVSLRVRKANRMLAKNQNYSLTPLDKSAAFLNAPPPGQPGQPNGGAPNGANAAATAAANAALAAKMNAEMQSAVMNVPLTLGKDVKAQTSADGAVTVYTK